MLVQKQQKIKGLLKLTQHLELNSLQMDIDAQKCKIQLRTINEAEN